MKRISKDEADYVDLSTKRHCEDCSMFINPSSCDLVKGIIKPLGTCIHWKEKNKLVRK